MRLPKDTLFPEDLPARERAVRHAAEASRLLVSAPAMSKHGAIAQTHATLALYWQREAELEHLHELAAGS